MAIRIDPENNETLAMFKMVDFDGQEVLEVGCGDGRLTWLYAGQAAHVTGVDAWEEGITRAKENLPGRLEGRVDFHLAEFEEFAANSPPAVYDLAILAWSL